MQFRGVKAQFVHLLVFGLIVAGAFAQEFRGRVQGTITDTSQAAIVSATVTLLNVNTGVSTTRQTNEAGHYIFDLVDPGTYTVTVEFAGFSKFVQENINLAQRGDVTVNATLKAGGRPGDDHRGCRSQHCAVQHGQTRNHGR